MARKWMPLYVGDYLAKTMHLNATQSGAYLHLIFHEWLHGSLPKGDLALARIAKVDARKWHLVKAVIEGYFGRSSVDGSWTNSRVAEELLRYSELSNKRKEAALASVSAKRVAKSKQNDSKTSANDSAKTMQTGGYARARLQSHIETLSLGETQSVQQKEAKPNGGSLATAPLGSALASPPSAVPSVKEEPPDKPVHELSAAEVIERRKRKAPPPNAAAKLKAELMAGLE